MKGNGQNTSGGGGGGGGVSVLQMKKNPYTI